MKQTHYTIQTIVRRCATTLFTGAGFLALTSYVHALPPGNWTQTFNEDFNGTALDTSKWSTGYLWSPVINNELEGMRPENVTVANGLCTIKVEKRDCWHQSFGGYQFNSNSHYASGCITTFNKFTQAYGYFEARIQTPTCKGAWPAFWMLPDRGPAYGAAAVDNTGQRSWFTVSGQPNGAEIDILESFGSWKKADNTAKSHQGFIWNYSPPSGVNGSLADYSRTNNGLGNTLYLSNPDTEWHTYGVYWAPGSLTFYIDDVIVNYWTDPNVPDCPQYLLLNCALALNDWTGTPLTTADIDAGLPGNMKIDWVRAYSGTATAPVPFTTTWVGRDINNGSPMTAGSDTWNGSAVTVRAEGAWGMGGTEGDWGRLTFKSMSGDGSIVARVTRIDDVGQSAASAGLIIRQDANFKSKAVYLYTCPTWGGHGMWSRASATGSTTGPFSLGQSVPVWMKLVRSGDVFTGYFSTDGVNWGTPVSTVTVPMSSIVQIGLATSSRVGNTLTTAIYDNVAITSSTPTNLALGRPVTASSVENSSYVASKAVDSVPGTRWSSAFSDPQWISVDLGSTKSISRVKLNWETAYGKAFQIQTSNDGSTWTTIYSTTNGTGGINDLTGLSASGRYVRMNGTVRGTVWGYSLWDFEVWGQ